MITNEELSEMRWLPAEIERAERQLSRIERKRRHPPRYITGDTLREYDAALDELHGVIRGERDRRKRQLDRLREFIANIPDHEIKELFRLRYEKGRTWLFISLQTAENGGCYFSEENAKMTVYRYLQKVNRQEAGGDTEREGMQKTRP